jgi:DNA ligase-associated metallophosphoesterase
MQQQVLHTIHNHDFWLTTDRCIYWPQQQALIVSDLHLGKTGHFRKHGINVPQQVFKEDMQRLIQAIAHFKPQQIIAVGDLFHSHANKELDFFSKWRKDFAQITFHLAKGNHDILQADWYKLNDIVVHDELVVEGFSFIHDTNHQQPSNESKYVFSGHMHPSIALKVGTKQNLSFPCFYFTKTMGVLPAFSRFSGTMNIKKKTGDHIYAIVNNSILGV